MRTNLHQWLSNCCCLLVRPAQSQKEPSIDLWLSKIQSHCQDAAIIDIIAIAQGLALPAVSTVIQYCQFMMLYPELVHANDYSSPKNEYLLHAIGWKSRPCRVGDVKCLPENPTGHGWSPTGQQ